MRFAQVRAELALLQENWPEAIRAADEAIKRGRATGRVKYIVGGLAARGRALGTLGRITKGMADLRLAVQLAQELGDPAVFLHAAAALLSVQGDDALATQARSVARQSAATLPSLKLREQFEAFVSELF
jgi:N-methylhydantoinase A/oxoprolinase/acetone carboxylase beta subunit